MHTEFGESVHKSGVTNGLVLVWSFPKIQLHPWKLTWHRKIPMFNRKYIFIHGGFSIFPWVMLVFGGGGCSSHSTEIYIWVFPKIGGKPPKWMVKIMVPNPMNKWMIWGVFPLFLVPHPYSCRPNLLIACIDPRTRPKQSHTLGFQRISSRCFGVKNLGVSKKHVLVTRTRCFDVSKYTLENSYGTRKWNNMEVWKIIFLFNWVIFRFHVDFPGCMKHRMKIH